MLLSPRLRRDAEALHRHGAFTDGAIGGRDPAAVATARRTRLCDVCGLFDDASAAPRGVGDRAARDELFDRIADLREELEAGPRGGRQLADHMELQYLRYPEPAPSEAPSGGKALDQQGGGFYRRHVDQQGGSGRGGLERAVSLLVYLNGADWDSARDGGQLVGYPAGRPPAVVEPRGGTLVLFDSRALEHEARPTRRERWALVGWFMDPQQRGRAAGAAASRSGATQAAAMKKKNRGGLMSR